MAVSVRHGHTADSSKERYAADVSSAGKCPLLSQQLDQIAGYRSLWSHMDQDQF